MRPQINWQKWNHHLQMRSICNGEEKTLTPEEIEQANTLIEEMSTRIAQLNEIFAKAIGRFKDRV